MAVGTSNFGELLWPGIKDIWGDTYNQWKSIYPTFFDVMKSDKAFEKFQGAAGLGTAAVKTQGASVAYADPLLTFQQVIEPVTYALGSTVTIEMFEDDQYSFINKIPSFLATSLRQTEEIIAHGVINNGFSSQTTPDGASLFSVSHPRADGGGNQANTPVVAADLTQTSLENAENTINSWTDDRGLKIYLKGKRLVVPVAQQWQAKKVLETKFEVDTANNTVNPIEGMYNLTVSPFITDPDSWYLMTDCPTGLVFTRRRAPKIERDNEFNTLNLQFITHSRFGVGVVNFRCAYGSPGA